MSAKPKKLSKEAFNEIYRLVPRLSVDLLINREGSIVLSKRDIDPGRGKWHLPGGTILFGETVEEAVKRIAVEETGLCVEVVEILGIIEYSARNAFGQAVSVVFLVHPKFGRLKGSEQAEKIDFFTDLPRGIMGEVRNFLIRSKLGER